MSSVCWSIKIQEVKSQNKAELMSDTGSWSKPGKERVLEKEDVDGFALWNFSKCVMCAYFRKVIIKHKNCVRGPNVFLSSWRCEDNVTL